MKPPCLVILINILVFSLYNIYILNRFRVPNNLSMTYYWMERQHKHLGLLFPVLILVMLSTTIPIWIHTSLNLSEWTARLTWLIYASLVTLGMVGISARYKRSRALTVFHYTAAISCAVFSIGWIFLACFNIIYIGFSILLLCGFAAWTTRTFRSCWLYWLELTGFYVVFFTLFMANLLYI